MSSDKSRTFSFSGSGMLLTYHAGVAMEVHHLCRRALGVSGGSIIAALIICNPDALPKLTDFLTSREWARNLSWADWWDPADRMIRQVLSQEDVLPPNAYQKANGNLRIFVTRLDDRTLHLFDHWESNDELISTIQASCSWGKHGVEVRGERYWDGGMAKDGTLVEREDEETITVCPFSGRNDVSIHPKSDGWFGFNAGGWEISWSNFMRLLHMGGVPHSTEMMKDYVNQGRSDAKRWLNDNDAL